MATPVARPSFRSFTRSRGRSTTTTPARGHGQQIGTLPAAPSSTRPGADLDGLQRHRLGGALGRDHPDRHRPDQRHRRSHGGGAGRYRRSDRQGRPAGADTRSTPPRLRRHGGLGGRLHGDRRPTPGRRLRSQGRGFGSSPLPHGGTLGDLKQRIIDETNRDDLRTSSCDALNRVIADAIDFYAAERWWFNERASPRPASSATSTSPARPGCACSTKPFLLVGGVRYDLTSGRWSGSRGCTPRPSAASRPTTRVRRQRPALAHAEPRPTPSSGWTSRRRGAGLHRPHLLQRLDERGAPLIARGQDHPVPRLPVGHRHGSAHHQRRQRRLSGSLFAPEGRDEPADGHRAGEAVDGSAADRPGRRAGRSGSRCACRSISRASRPKSPSGWRRSCSPICRPLHRTGRLPGLRDRQEDRASPMG
jgi:hypothetical protein